MFPLIGGKFQQPACARNLSVNGYNGTYSYNLHPGITSKGLSVQRYFFRHFGGVCKPFSWQNENTSVFIQASHMMTWWRFFFWLALSEFREWIPITMQNLHEPLIPYEGPASFWKILHRLFWGLCSWSLVWCQMIPNKGDIQLMLVRVWPCPKRPWKIDPFFQTWGDVKL